MEPIGKRRWAIAEGYIPPSSTGETRQLRSHETACILNAGDADAHIAITVFHADREPDAPHQVVVPARRTLHLRLDELGIPVEARRDRGMTGRPPGGRRSEQRLRLLHIGAEGMIGDRHPNPISGGPEIVAGIK